MPTLYTMDGCVKCVKAKKHLQEQNIPYDEVNILKSPGSAETVKELVGEVYTPVLVMGEHTFKGLNILHVSQDDFTW